jgi:uncharacterized protein
MRRLCSFLFALLLTTWASAAEVIPPPPPQYFNDFANVTSPATRQQLNQQLLDFDSQTTNQVVVAIYPKMQSDSSIEDYTVRVAQKWRVGQKLRKNGVVLFVFIQDRKLYIQVGYGLEGALPDALCRQIIDDEITPRFKEGNYDAGLSAGVAAIMAATKGEYRAKAAPSGVMQFVPCFILLGFILFVLMLIRWRVLGSHAMWIPGAMRGRGGRIYYGGGWGSGGGWSGGGSFGGGGGGGFSGGGGSFGGGGAGGSW